MGTEGEGGIRVLVLHKEAFVRESMAAGLEKAGGFVARPCPMDLRQAVELARDWSAEVALVAIAPGVHLLTSRLLGEYPRLRILGLADKRDLGLAPHLLELGFAGLISFSADIAAITSAVRAVASGYVVLTPNLPAGAADAPDKNARSLSSLTPDGLTPRQMQIVGLATQGLTDAEIARVLGISGSSVRAQIKSILKKTGARTRAHMVVLRVRGSVGG